MKNYGHKIRENGLVYPGIDLKTRDSSIVCRYIIIDKFKECISDSSLRNNIESGRVTSQVQRYSYVTGSNHVRRMYLEKIA